MRRQNSVPTAEPPTQLNAVASAMRRLSHDLRLPRLFAERVSGGDHTITHTNKKKPIQPSIFSTGRRNTQQQRQQQQTTAVTTPPRSYTFGYASAARISPSVPSAIYDDDADDDDDDDDEMASEDFDSTGERPTTSSAYGAATKSEGCKAAAATTTIDDVNTIDVELGVVEAELYVCRIGGGGSGSNGGGTLVPLYARCVGGEAADRFCESLDSALRERLRRFLVAESPAADEWHVWLRCDATGEVNIQIFSCNQSKPVCRRSLSRSKNCSIIYATTMCVVSSGELSRMAKLFIAIRCQQSKVNVDFAFNNFFLLIIAAYSCLCGVW